MMDSTRAATNMGRRIDAYTQIQAAAGVWLEIDTENILGFLEAARIAYGGAAREAGVELEPNWLYRLYDDGGRLLYIGITRNLEARLRSHRRRLGDLLAHHTVEQYPDRATALQAEARAIEEEYPAFNVDHPEAWV